MTRLQTTPSLEPSPAGRPIRVAYLVTHPIQYQAPLLRMLAQQPDIDLTVFFQSDLSMTGYHDEGFGRAVKWDVPLVEGYRHEFLPALGPRNRVDRLWPFSYGITSRLWRGRFDVLWIHGYARWFNWVAMIAAVMIGLPVLVRDEATAISAPRSALKTRLKSYIFKLLSKMCAGFLAIGTLNRQYYINNGIDPGRIVTMPYCVDNAYFKELAESAAPHRETLRAELGLTPGRPIILFASKFQARKRAHDLIAAYEKLIAMARSGAKPYLLLVGDGEQTEQLRAKAAVFSDDIRFFGFRNQSELPPLYDLCDVFVLPSDSEPWGLVVNEVMNAARPIIVSDQVGCGPDLVRSGLNGFIFPVGDVDALAEALGRCLSEASTTTAMGRASADIIATWDFQRDIDALRQAIHALVTPGPRGTP